MTGIKSRAYASTVQTGHGSLKTHLNAVARLHEEGLIDYAIYCAESSRAGTLHLQGFIIFNEAALENKQQPTDLLSGHFVKARSLTGARDYIAREGIHYKKEGLHSSYEFGEWVDAGYNINIKFRKQYQFAEMIKEGFTPTEIAKYDPAGSLLVSLNSLKDLFAAYNSSSPRIKTGNEPYYYIGLQQFSERVDIDELGWPEQVSSEEE